MDLMNSVAAQAMNMASAQLAQSYSIALTKNIMNSQEQIAQELLEMLPETPAPMKGQYIDTYA